MKADEAELAWLLADAGAIAWNASSDQLAVDDTAARLFGSHATGFGRDLTSLLRRVREGSRDALTDGFERAIGDGAIFDIVVDVELPDGSSRKLHLRGAPLGEPGGDDHRVVISARDHSALTGVQNALDTLHKQMVERDAKHALAETLLERSARARAEVVEGLSREIRTRLGAVLGMSNLLLDSALTADQRDQIAAIAAAGDELLASTSDAIDVSSSATPDEHELTIASPQDLIARAIAKLGAVASERKLRVRALVGPEVPSAMRVDAARLERAIVHVLRERAAVLAIGSEIAVTASSSPLAGQLHDLVIDIADGGEPISDTAIGIRLGHRLMQRIGGQLVIPRDGGRARVLLEISVDESTVPATGSVVIDPLLGMKHPLRILVAEDNAMNWRVMDAYCARLGYTPRRASNGREAIEAIEADRVDLVFMDIQMPEVDGLEATQRIRAQHRGTRGPRIVALTANALPADRAACLRAGCDDYLTKPVTLEKLIAAIVTCPPPETPPAVRAALNQHRLSRLDLALGAKLLADVLRIHVDDAREVVHAMRGAAERGEVGSLSRLGKTLMRSADVIGATTLVAAARTLVSECEDGAIAEARGRVDAIVTELAQARLALEPRLSPA